MGRIRSRHQRRELHYASAYGVNCVRVFLHYLIYKKKKEALLRDMEDFLTRADKYHIKVEFIFFDSCWNQPPGDLLSPGYKYPSPIYGAHNSSWLQSPGKDALTHYQENKDTLKAYVQDIVNAHKDDTRIAFWETYNEPAEDDAVKRLLADSIQWIHETGTTIPVTATSGQWFPGRASSDFLTFHDYNSSDWLPKEGSEALCTECMNRKDQSVASVVSQFRGRCGFIVWELGIGRDNCRFSWDQKVGSAAKSENVVPFHGLIYPDGHPWSLDDMRAYMGEAEFAKAPFFKVRYYLDPNSLRRPRTR